MKSYSGLALLCMLMAAGLPAQSLAPAPASAGGTLRHLATLHEGVKSQRVSSYDRTGRHSMYRFHLEDPVMFDRSIRMTIEHGAMNDRSDDYSSVGYWYQTEPHKSFPPLKAVTERLPVDRWTAEPIK